MTTLTDYQENIAERMSAGVNYLLETEGVLTGDLAEKLNRTITEHSEAAAIRTYGEINEAAANGYLSEDDAKTLAHRLSTQLVMP